MMIESAKNKLLTENPGGLPDMGSAMTNWFQKLVFMKVTKEVQNFELVEIKQEYYAQGIRQPLSAQQLQMKPEGQRAWKWQTIHATPALVLEIDEIVIFADTPYRVMAKLDWKEYGYVEYHIAEDYKSP